VAGTDARGVVGGGLDQLVVQVWLVTQLGAVARVESPAGFGLATPPAGCAGAAGSVVRTDPLEPALGEFPLPVVPVVSALAAGGAAALGPTRAPSPVLGGGGVLDDTVPAILEGFGSLWAIKERK